MTANAFSWLAYGTKGMKQVVLFWITSMFCPFNNCLIHLPLHHRRRYHEGLLKREPKLWIANVVGTVMGVYYVLSFARIAPKGMKSSTLPGSISLHVDFLLALAAYVLFFAKAEKTFPIAQLGIMINLVVSIARSDNGLFTAVGPYPRVFLHIKFFLLI
jgi:uncharacterized protein (DUF3820 family)